MSSLPSRLGTILGFGVLAADRDSFDLTLQLGAIIAWTSVIVVACAAGAATIIATANKMAANEIFFIIDFIIPSEFGFVGRPLSASIVPLTKLRFKSTSSKCHVQKVFRGGTQVNTDGTDWICAIRN